MLSRFFTQAFSQGNDPFAIVSAEGSLVFKIEHNQFKDMGPGGSFISPDFWVGPHRWFLSYYPQGLSADEAPGQYNSLYLGLRRSFERVKASFHFAILDKQLHWTSSPIIMHTFTPEKPEHGVHRMLEVVGLEEAWLHDGAYLVLKLSLTLSDEQTGRYPLPLPFPRENFQRFLVEGKHTDVVFDLGTVQLPAHSQLLAVHSTGLENLIFKGAARYDQKIISITDAEPAIFKALLDFVYTGVLSADALGDGPEALSFVLNLITLAERYGFELLKNKCEVMLVGKICDGTIVFLLRAAEKHHLTGLRRECMEFLVDKDDTAFTHNHDYMELMLNNPSLRSEMQKMFLEKKSK